MSTTKETCSSPWRVVTNSTSTGVRGFSIINTLVNTTGALPFICGPQATAAAAETILPRDRTGSAVSKCAQPELTGTGNSAHCQIRRYRVKRNPASSRTRRGANRSGTATAGPPAMRCASPAVSSGRHGQAELVQHPGRHELAEQPRPALGEQPAEPPLGQCARPPAPGRRPAPSPAISTSAPAFPRRPDPVRGRRRPGQHQGRHQRRGEEREREVQVQARADHRDRRAPGPGPPPRAARRRPRGPAPAGSPPGEPSPRRRPPRRRGPAGCRRSACRCRQEMGWERPSCWAAPSRVETMLARSQGRRSPSGYA